MGFWLLVGMFLRGETNHSWTYYRWWKYWIPNWIDGYERGVLDTSNTIEKEGWVCILGLYTRSYCIPLHQPSSWYKHQVVHTFEQQKVTCTILYTSFREWEIDGHHRKQRWSIWPTQMSVLWGVTILSSVDILSGALFNL